MYEGSKLINLGKELASGYVSNGENLNEGLQKVASAHGLNTHQVSRVAETANVETYLSLVKRADEGYIEFDIADPKSIVVEKTKPENVKRSSLTSDFDQPPSYTFDADKLFDKNETYEPEYTKTASVRKDAYKTKDTLTFLEDRLFDQLYEYEKRAGEFMQLSKQHLLSGEDINDVKEIAKKASPNMHSHFWENSTRKLAQLGIPVETVDDYSTGKVVNTDSSLYKTAESLEHAGDTISKTAHAIDHYHERLSNIDTYPETNHPFEKVAGIFMDVVDFLKKHKMITGAGIGAGIAYPAGKNKGKAEQGEVLQKALVNVQGKKPPRNFNR